MNQKIQKRYLIRKKSKRKKIANIKRPSIVIIIIYYCFALINPNVKGVDVQIYREETKDKKKKTRRILDGF